MNSHAFSKTQKIASYISTRKKIDPSLQYIEEGRMRCLVCARQCLLADGQVGYCTAIVRDGEDLYSTAYGVISEASVTPIEKRPVYHYRPGTLTLCLGSLGCNLRCKFCQNWEVAFRDARQAGGLSTPNILPDQAVALALDKQCSGIAWTFNEPSIMPMYLLETARLAHEVGLYTVMVTNGLMTDQALTLLGPHIDVYRVDVKSLDPTFYRQVANTTRIADVFPVAQRARREFGIHVEAVTNLMPGLNDSDEHVVRLAAKLVNVFGPYIPWHVTSYIPYAHMKYIPATPPETLARARTTGQRAGLHFVYTDDSSCSDAAHTVCPACGTHVIARDAHQVKIQALRDDGACLVCGADLAIVFA